MDVLRAPARPAISRGGTLALRRTQVRHAPAAKIRTYKLPAGPVTLTARLTCTASSALDGELGPISRRCSSRTPRIASVGDERDSAPRPVPPGRMAATGRHHRRAARELAGRLDFAFLPLARRARDVIRALDVRDSGRRRRGRRADSALAMRRCRRVLRAAGAPFAYASALRLRHLTASRRARADPAPETSFCRDRARARPQAAAPRRRLHGSARSRSDLARRCSSTAWSRPTCERRLASPARTRALAPACVRAWSWPGAGSARPPRAAARRVSNPPYSRSRNGRASGSVRDWSGARACCADEGSRCRRIVRDAATLVDPPARSRQVTRGAPRSRRAGSGRRYADGGRLDLTGASASSRPSHGRGAVSHRPVAGAALRSLPPPTPKPSPMPTKGSRLGRRSARPRYQPSARASAR